MKRQTNAGKPALVISGETKGDTHHKHIADIDQFVHKESDETMSSLGIYDIIRNLFDSFKSQIVCLILIL